MITYTAAAAAGLTVTVDGSGTYEALACSESLLSSQPAAAISTSLSANLSQKHSYMLSRVKMKLEDKFVDTSGLSFTRHAIM